MYIDQLFMKAHTKHQKGNHAAAARLYRDLLRINPNHLDANYLLGTLYAETGQLDEARQYLEKADSINPESPYIKVNLGNIYKLQGDFERSKNQFSLAIALKDDLAPAHFGLGSILEDFENDLDRAYVEYQKALELSPNDPMMLQAFGRALAKLGDERALDYFSKAILLHPKLYGIHKDIGLAALDFGQTATAVQHLLLAHKEVPEDVKVRFFLSIAEGVEPDEKLKLHYAQEEFDAYADAFDLTLTGRLGYNAPAQMLEFLLETCSDALPLINGVDLGCGTGLSGSVFKKYVNTLTGIDISGKMLAQAQKRGCYDSLLKGDVVTALKEISGSVDLFLATDLIIYVGPIEALFSAAKEKAASKALFLLTTESHDGELFTLRHSGRYAHSHAYIESASAAHGFEIIGCRAIPLRKECGKWLDGEMFILRYRI